MKPLGKCLLYYYICFFYFTRRDFFFSNSARSFVKYSKMTNKVTLNLQSTLQIIKLSFNNRLNLQTPPIIWPLEASSGKLNNHAVWHKNTKELGKRVIKSWNSSLLPFDFRAKKSSITCRCRLVFYNH